MIASKRRAAVIAVLVLVGFVGERAAHAAPIVGPEISFGPALYGATSTSSPPAVACAGSVCLVVWTGVSGPSGGVAQVFAARTDVAGTLLDPAPIPVGGSGSPAVATDGTDFFVTWQASGSTPPPRAPAANAIYGARITHGGALVDSTSVLVATNSGSGTAPSVAFDGTNYVVAYQGPQSIVPTLPSVFAARVSREGSLLDPAGILVAQNAALTQPAVASDGTNSLVTWTTTDANVRGARLSRTGVVLDTAPLQISNNATSTSETTVVFDGTDYLVAWVDQRSTGAGAGAYGARVAKSGTVATAPDAFLVAGVEQSPRLSFDGTDYLLAWVEHSPTQGVFASRIGPDLAALDPAGALVTTFPGVAPVPSVAFAGDGYLLVSAPDSYVVGDTISAKGKVSPASSAVLSTGIATQTMPSVAFDGTNYLAVWQELRGGASTTSAANHLYVARVDAQGNVLDSAVEIPGAAPWYGAQAGVAFDGTNYLVVWTDVRSGTNANFGDIYGARVSRAGVVLDTTNLAVSVTVGSQLAPTVAFDGTSFVVMWTDYQLGGISSFGSARVSGGDGAVTARQSTPFGPPNGLNLPYSPKLACNAAHCLVAWVGYYDGVGYMGALDASGAVTTTTPLSTNGGYQANVSIAPGSDGRFLVAWSSRPQPSAPAAIFASRFDDGAKRLDTAPIELWNPAPAVTGVSVAVDSEAFWVGAAGVGTSNVEVWRVAQDGQASGRSLGVSNDGSGPCALVAGTNGQLLSLYQGTFSAADSTVRAHARLLGLAGVTLDAGVAMPNEGGIVTLDGGEPESDASVVPPTADGGIGDAEPTNPGTSDASTGSRDSGAKTPRDAALAPGRDATTQVDGSPVVGGRGTTSGVVGCSCRTAASPRSTRAGWLGVFAAAAALRRRRQAPRLRNDP